MFSTPIRGTAPKKNRTTMNWWEYWIGHCWMTGWQSIRYTFYIWRDLMSSNFDGYALMKNDDPQEECLEWFWTSINEDDTYPKDFLEELMAIVDRIDRGEEKVYPLEEDFFEKLQKELFDEDEESPQ
jgi:hypothetical protein